MIKTMIKLGAKIGGLSLTLLMFGCSDDDKPLAPFQGERDLSDILIESNSFEPGMTWAGGYVSALGVNKGTVAALDSTLVWLIVDEGDELRFPVTFGQVPSGAQELSTDYGGQPLTTLVEDNVYTFWLLQNEAWQQAKDNPGKILSEAPQGSSAVEVKQDTVFIHQNIHAQLTQSLDVFVNIADLRTFGRLGNISITEPSTNPGIVVSWQITQSDVTDSSIAAIGLTEGQQYDPSTTTWEVWSEDTVDGQPVFGSLNIIESPLVLGESLPGTRTFAEFPEEGLERDRFYYIWIANNNWDGESRLRSASFYAYATFRTW